MEGRILVAKIKELIYHYKTLFLALLGLFIGFSVSSGLLLYSGKELVNALIYLFFVVALPALFSVITLFLVLFKREEAVILRAKESFFFGLFFSIGALVALIVTIAIKDIAFGWATTLNISPKEIVSFLNSFAIWKSFCSSCIIDQKLANISQITRLGGAVSSKQIAMAKELGEWWKYLAMAILFYGVALRALFFGIVRLFKGDSKIGFESSKNSDSFDGLVKSTKEPKSKSELINKEIMLVGYDVVNLESLGLVSTKDAKEVVVVVNSWEPPVLEFFDFAKEFEKSGKRVSLLLLGLNNRDASSSDIAIWQDKLVQLNKDYEVYV